MSISLALLLAACGSAQPPLPTLAYTIPPFPTSTAFPTVTPFPERLPVTGLDVLPSPLPTRERYDPLGATQTALAALPTEPRPTIEPTATEEPLATGQLSGWILGLIPSDQGLWAMYPDGTRMTLLTNDPIDHFVTSPGGTWGAYLTHTQPGELYQQPYGYLLKLITIGDSRTFPITLLDPPGLASESAPVELDSAVQLLSAYEFNAMQWAPDGRTLAFVSSHETPPGQPASGDIYLYYPGNGSIRRLTQLSMPEGPVYAHDLQWSPDGRRIFFSAAYSFGASADAGGTWLAGSWVVDLAGQMVQMDGGENSTGERLHAWLPGPSLLLSSRSLLCGDSNLRVFNLWNNAVNTLWPGCYSDIDYNRSMSEVLISLTEELSLLQEDAQPGLYLARTYQSGITKIADTGFERLYSGDSRATWYGFNTGQGMYAIQRNGQILDEFTGPPYDSSEGMLYRPLNRLTRSEAWLWTNVESGEVFVAQRGSAPTTSLTVPPREMSASPSISGLYFFFTPGENGAELYGVRARDWQPFLIEDRIRSPKGIVWVP